MSRVAIRTIITTWKACNQNYSETARQLGIDRRTVAASASSDKRWVDRGRQPFGDAADGRGYVRWQGIQRQSTAPKHPKRALQGEAAAQVRAWREATGFCREKLRPGGAARAGRLRVDHSPLSATSRTHSGQHQSEMPPPAAAAAAPLPERAGHAAQ